MTFISHNRKYEVDRFGVINQLDAQQFTYDPGYVSTYDKPEYIQQSELLQALRLGFASAAHGRRITSLLDYGYGNGAFMKFAKRHVPNVYGFDLTGLHVDGCYIMPEVIKADVITFWDALEHVADLSFLRGLPAETVVVSLPYCHMLTEGRDWFSNQYKHRKPDEHLHHFNEFSLANVMAHYGWKAIASSGHEDIVRKSAHGLQNILSMAFKRSA